MSESDNGKKTPKVIGISGSSGMGKTTLALALGDVLKATKIFWDDFDELSSEPDDYIKWYRTSKNYSEWDYSALAEVLKTLKSGSFITSPATKEMLVPTEFIIFDAPLGYRHTQTGKYIDFLIFVNTPLDIALARRLLRDFKSNEKASKEEILNEIEFYLSSRELYAMYYEENHDANLVIDGCLSVEEQVKKALTVIAYTF